MSKIPRNISGRELTLLLINFGYNIVREKGSHIRLISNFKGHGHKITIPDHKEIKIGTLNNILNHSVNYLQIPKAKLIKELFTK